MDTATKKHTGNQKAHQKTIFKHIHVSRTKSETKTSQAHQPKQAGNMIHSNNGFSLGSRAYQESEWWSVDSRTETPQQRWMLGLTVGRRPNRTFPLFPLL